MGGAVTALLVLAGVTQVAVSPYGPPVPVWVAAADLQPGDRVAPDDLRRVNWPEELVPDGAVAEPSGTVRAPLPVGAVLTDRHLGDDGPAAGLADGRVAVAVPVEALPPLPVGSRLDLVATDVDGHAVTLARAARVTAVDDTTVWIAVDHREAADVGAGALHRSLGAVLLPP